MTRRTRALITAITLVGAALSTPAHAKLGQICLEMPAGANVVKAEIASGCIGSGRSYRDDFNIVVDAERALISIDGEFRLMRDPPRIGTADCMGSRVIEQEAEAAGARRYSVMINGTYRGVLDASSSLRGARDVRECFAGRSQLRLGQSAPLTVYAPHQFGDWISAGEDSSHSEVIGNRYGSLAELAAALQSDHPESMEGQPSVVVRISPARWQRNRPIQRLGAPFMAIRVEEHGYSDDSVSGSRIFAAAKLDEASGTWQITDLWHQFMCARGSRAGQWTDQPCG